MECVLKWLQRTATRVQRPYDVMLWLSNFSRAPLVATLHAPQQMARQVLGEEEESFCTGEVVVASEVCVHCTALPYLTGPRIFRKCRVIFGKIVSKERVTWGVCAKCPCEYEIH